MSMFGFGAIEKTFIRKKTQTNRWNFLVFHAPLQIDTKFLVGDAKERKIYHKLDDFP